MTSSTAAIPIHRNTCELGGSLFSSKGHLPPILKDYVCKIQRTSLQNWRRALTYPARRSTENVKAKYRFRCLRRFSPSLWRECEGCAQAEPGSALGSCGKQPREQPWQPLRNKRFR